MKREFIPQQIERMKISKIGDFEIKFENPESNINNDKELVKIINTRPGEIIQKIPKELNLGNNEIERKIELELSAIINGKNKNYIISLLLAIKKEVADKKDFHYPLFKENKETFFTYEKLREATQFSKKILKKIIFGEEIYCGDIKLFIEYLKNKKIAFQSLKEKL